MSFVGYTAGHLSDKSVGCRLNHRGGGVRLSRLCRCTLRHAEKAKTESCASAPLRKYYE
jgi:hypothetical protein